MYKSSRDNNINSPFVSIYKNLPSSYKTYTTPFRDYILNLIHIFDMQSGETLYIKHPKYQEYETHYANVSEKLVH